MNDDFLWTPPGMDSGELSTYLVLSSGLPSHAMESVINWYFDFYAESGYMYSRRLTDFQTARRRDLALQDVGLIRRNALAAAMRSIGEVECAYLIDYTLSAISASRSYNRKVDQIQKILRESGAGWEVVERGGRWRLQEALPGAVLSGAEEIVSSASRSSALLRGAWEAAFGMSKRPSHAYYDAVRAVEVYSCPLISPADKNATLGKDINVLRSGGHKFSFALQGSQQQSGVEHLVGVLQLLWHSQSDRHGRSDYEDVSQEEAQAAVLLAITLVGWLSRGLLTRIGA